MIKSILFAIAIFGGLLMAYPGEAFERMEDPSLILMAEIIDKKDDSNGCWWWMWWCDSKKGLRLPVIQLTLINDSDEKKKLEWTEEWFHHVKVHVVDPDKKKLSITHPCRDIWLISILGVKKMQPRQKSIVLSTNLLEIVGALNENAFIKKGVYKLTFEFWCHQRIGEDINSQLFLVVLESNSIQFELK